MRMKRLGASLVLAAALALLPARAASADILDLSAGVFPDDELAALSSSGDPFAVGGGSLGVTMSGTQPHFAFSAHLGANGPSGYAVVSDPALGEAQGHVCLYQALANNAAEFWIDVEKGSGFLGSGSNVHLVAFDFGGEPPSGAPDELDIVQAEGCGAPIGGGVGGFVVQGNIVVKP
jgi:hypothetical protein